MNPVVRSGKTRILAKQVFLLLLCLDLALSLSLGSISRILQQEKQQHTLEHSWPPHNQESEDVDALKRTCDGFPCMYNHIASNAGRAALERAMSSFISGCFSNAACDPDPHIARLFLQDMCEAQLQGTVVTVRKKEKKKPEPSSFPSYVTPDERSAGLV